MKAGWVRVETRFMSHPKVLEIGPLGEALWLRGLCYSGEQLTDGFIPTSFIKRMSDIKGIAIAARLTAVGLWEEVDGGYQVHDYLEWQRSRDDAEDISLKRAESGRRGGQQKASNFNANGKQNASKLLESPASKRLPDTEEIQKRREGDTEPEEEYIAAQSAKPKRRAQIPADWEPGEAGRQFAVSRGMATDEDIDREVGRFRDFHRSKANTFADHEAAWRTWCGNYIGFKPRVVPDNRGPKGPDFAARARELEAQERALR